MGFVAVVPVLSDAADVPDLRELGWVRRAGHGSGVFSLHYDRPGPDGIGIEHVCTRPRDGATLRVAPVLSPGHQVASTDPLTVTPSVLCQDCGLHGFITAGVWS